MTGNDQAVSHGIRLQTGLSTVEVLVLCPAPMIVERMLEHVRGMIASGCPVSGWHDPQLGTGTVWPTRLMRHQDMCAALAL